MNGALQIKKSSQDSVSKLVFDVFDGYDGGWARCTEEPESETKPEGKFHKPELVCLGSPSPGRCRIRPIRNLLIKEGVIVAKLTTHRCGIGSK